MDLKLKKLKDIKAQNCITIILNTHRTSPLNSKDSVKLKNLVAQAEKRLLEKEDSKEIKNIIKSLKNLSKDINHNNNLESLILFVNEDIAEYIRLPITVEDRVIIDDTFATRDIIRALHSEADYYVLILNQKEARLIEVLNDKVVQEITEEGFPMENEHWFRIRRADPANATRQRNLISEFFNRVDKKVNKIRNINPLPILICADEANYNEYLKIADNKNIYLKTYLKQNKIAERNNIIAKDAWKVVKEDIKERKEKRKEELKEAKSTGKFLDEINDIWLALQKGKVRTLFIEEGLFQPGILETQNVKLVSEDEKKKEGVFDDVYDEMIEVNMDFGGDVVFLPKGELKEYNGFVAITRY